MTPVYDEVQELLYAEWRERKGYPPETPEVKWVRRYMWRTDTTQKSMAEALGMDQSHFSKVITGKRRMNRKEFTRLAEIIPDPFPIEELKEWHG